jgi:hypothetical protein
VFERLVAVVGQAECTELTVVKASDGTLPLGGGGGLSTWRLQELMMDKAGAFRCTDAHTAMAALSAVPESGHLLYQRGTRRVLLTTAAWGTVCLDTSALETEAGVRALWSGATKALVADRHANP